MAKRNCTSRHRPLPPPQIKRKSNSKGVFATAVRLLGYVREPLHLPVFGQQPKQTLQPNCEAASSNRNSHLQITTATKVKGAD
jgi:hypothetical protein